MDQAPPPARRPAAAQRPAPVRGPAEVVRMKISRNEITAKDIPELQEIYNGLDRLPLANSDVEIELKGVSTAVVNAIRRTSINEIRGFSLQVPADGFDIERTTDPFMLPQFVKQRIALIPLRPQIPEDVVSELRFDLDVKNETANPVVAYSGDLRITQGRMPGALFNPTFQIAVVQGGKRLVIRGIRIESGYGRGAFNVARLARYTHLDIEQHPRSETHEPGGVAADLSGYKVSSLVADPRHHLFMAVIPATSENPAEVRTVFADVCKNIRDRLQLVVTSIGDSANNHRVSQGFASRGILYTVTTLEGGLTVANLVVPGETHTIGELLKREIFDLDPNVAYVAYTIDPHEQRLKLTVRHASADVTDLIIRAAQACMATFDTIRDGIMGAA